MKNMTVAQFKRAAEIQEKIDAFQAELDEILSGKPTVTVVAKDGKRTLSAKARKAIAEGQHKRWAAFHAAKAAAPAATAPEAAPAPAPASEPVAA